MACSANQIKTNTNVHTRMLLEEQNIKERSLEMILEFSYV